MKKFGSNTRSTQLALPVNSPSATSFSPSIASRTQYLETDRTISNRFSSALVFSLCLFSLLSLGLAESQGQETKSEIKSALPTRFWPEDVSFDSSIPTPKDFFGFDIGFRHLRHDQIVNYLKELDRKSDRISLQEYGQTHGGRPLLLATITSPENLQNITEIKKAHQSLASGAEDQKVDPDLPVVMNMGYSVHGDEPSAGNCAPLVAYYLAAAKGEKIQKTLDSVVVLLDPVLNPDGFDRFARWANTFRGRVLNSDPAHAEHRQGWPAGRVNYYWFDLNRDWLPLVHPESQARMNWYHDWKPNVVLDFHEMGTNSTFFFQPGVPKRTNPLTPKENIQLTGLIGNYHAKSFDKNKVLYFTQEVFDDFYMGKGSTYPDLHGAIGILFEQASSRGHLQESDNGLVRFPETISNQFSASLSSLKAATELKTKLNNYKQSFYQKSIQMAKDQTIKTHLFRCPGNPDRLNKFAALLQKHDIQSFRLSGEPENSITDKKTLIVPAEQSEYRFLKSLIEKRTKFEEEIFYDVSAWTIPVAYNLEHEKSEKKIDQDNLVPWSKNPFTNASGFTKLEKDDVAVVIDWRDDRSTKFLYALLNQGLNVKVATAPLTLPVGEEIKKFGEGTLVIPLGLEANRTKNMQKLVSKIHGAGVPVYTIKTGLTEVGVDLGSSKLRTLKKPSIAMIIESGVSAYGSGEIWHALDTRLSVPVTLLKTSSLGSAKLSRYNTIILPNGRYSLKTESLLSLQDWVEKGGTLIATGSACSIVDQWRKGRRGKAQFKSSDPIQLPFNSSSKTAALKLISGAIFQTRIDRTHPMFYGFPSDTLGVFKTHSKTIPASNSPYANPMVYTRNPLIGGYASEENQNRLSNTAGVVVQKKGRGRTVSISDNLNFRGFWLGTQRAFFNAIFFRDQLDPPRR